jgi:V8-like Glu-specific endopeptidase
MPTRQIQSGNSIGVPAGVNYPDFGTLGLGVADNKGDSCAITCAHVVADPRNGNPKGVSVQSPGAVGENISANIIGAVSGWVPIGDGVSTVDVGVVTLNSTVSLSNAPLGLAAAQVAINYRVADFAMFAGSGITVFTKRGPVAATAGPVVDQVINFPSGTYSFANLLSYAASSGSFEEGDSGSAVVDNTQGQFLGIHLAGIGSDGYCTLAAQIWIAFSDSYFTFLK